MTATCDGWFKIPLDELKAGEEETIKQKLTIPDYDYQNAIEMGVKYDGDKWEKMYEEHDGVLYLPRAFGLSYAAEKMLPFTDNRVVSDNVDFGPSSFVPRDEEQAQAVEQCLKMLQILPLGSSSLIAPCGRGKSVLGVEVIRQMKQKVAVIVHKEFLMDQWEEHFNNFLPSATIGRLQGKRADEGTDILMVMIQSLLTEREYPATIFDNVGFILIDEAHHVAAKRFREAVVRFPARYRMLLTATPDRRDKREIVFQEHVGRASFVMNSRGLAPRIETLKTNSYYPATAYSLWRGSKKPSISKLITLLANDEDRTERICRTVLRAAKAGRQVIVLSDRLDHLDAMQEILRGPGGLNRGLTAAKYVGGMKAVEREKAEHADVLLGTFSMAQEGLDIPTLSVVVLATPRSNVEQSVGRILRELEGKAEPVVVDVVDQKIPICRAMGNKRRKLYAKLGYTGGRKTC